MAVLAAAGSVARAEDGRLPKVVWQGGDEDDRLFALAALGLRPGMTFTEADLALGLKAVRLTDRFREVKGRLTMEDGQTVIRLELTPWPELRQWSLEGTLPVPLRIELLPGLRKGMRMGDLRLEQFRSDAERRLRESGYPRAQVKARRGDDGLRVVFELVPGEPDLVRRVVFKGDGGEYGSERLLRLLRAQPGKTLCTESYRHEATVRVRQRFLKDKRYQGQAEVTFAADGTLTLTARPGPVVQLRAEGQGLGWKNLKELVPLARSERYSPELLDAGSRALVRFLRGKGYLDAEVTHRTEVLRGSAEAPQEIRIIYVLSAGQRLAVNGVNFQRNTEIDSRELEKAAALPSSWFWPWRTWWTTDLINATEERVKNLYRSRGYADVSLRRMPFQVDGNKGKLVLQMREGNVRRVESARLDLPADPGFDGWYLAESLTALFTDRPVKGVAEAPGRRRYRSDRAALDGMVGRIEEVTGPQPTVRRFVLTLEHSLPLQRADLAQMINTLRQRLSVLGSQKPAHKLTITQGSEGSLVVVDVPPQALSRVRRMVVRGSDETAARAILRRAQMEPGTPLSSDRLATAQVQVGGLGGLEQVELSSLVETQPGNEPWKEGDLLLKVGERSKWIFSSGFGYDKTQGYHFDVGVQRLNVGGMGRSLDFGFRAGDATLDNPTLRKWFPTGDFTRSVDMYRIGYQDPWFSPSWARRWLPEQTQLNSEVAYLEERRSAYQIRRRRLLGGLDWTTPSGLMFQAGYRFERAEVSAAPGSNIQTNDLALMARIPGRSIISAPYFQMIRDNRDNRLDPTTGTYGVVRFEFANQFFGTSPNSSFIKLDLRHQWNWAFGTRGSNGIVSLGLRVGVARPTASTAEELPLSERFFAGGPGTHRGVEPDSLGPMGAVPLRGGPPSFPPLLDAHGNPLYQIISLGGQGLALVNLEYRFPTWWPVLWGEVFVDSGQVYQGLKRSQAAGFPPFRTALGLGLIFKLGIPIKLEYAADVKRILGQPRTPLERETQLKSLLVSAGFQF
ncbi:MAG: BamA/TamA family outer membrane protein [Firmicutes bacterium]|nr:BamA/TamA family outer membrane protein [Bacillota bacterium]